MTDSSINHLLNRITQCTRCQSQLTHEPRPVVRVSQSSRILVIGQAPGRKVHASGIPWDDASGDRLRDWLGVNTNQFYDPTLFAIMPMGFCYPGTGPNGDYPPMKVCAPLWHPPLLNCMPDIELTLLIGQYAMKHYLPENKRKLTETVRNYHLFQPDFFVLPHPSPRNNIWQKKNPWFIEQVLPQLKTLVRQIL